IPYSCTIRTREKRTARPAFASFQSGISRSALGELERTASLALAILLSLDHARVPGQEAALLEDRPQLRLVIGQCLGNSVPYGPGLSGKSAARHRRHDVVLAVAIGCEDRLAQDHLQHRPSEILVVFLVVDDDAALARLDPHPGDGVLALAG